ncbi:putative cold-shock protein CspD [Organic Lake phycodnavirus]|jgi:CspA family cold shock protein|nr:putative cold-shock protein CspD [Organic Lake phycodnavirus]
MFQVKWFNKRKGFGFVLDETGTEYFCHHSDICNDGYKYLRAGEYVSGEVINMDGNKKKLSKICPPVPWGVLMCQLDTQNMSNSSMKTS